MAKHKIPPSRNVLESVMHFYPFVRDCSNFVLNINRINPIDVVNNFYVKNFSSVKYKNCYPDISLDCIYVFHSSNPIYHLYVASFLFPDDILKFTKYIYESDDIISQASDDLENYFNDDFRDQFYVDIECNSSIEGFLSGHWWKEARLRANEFLIKNNLDEEIAIMKPLKFPGFLYPDDFFEYQVVPHWSTYGERIDFDEWDKIRHEFFKLYDRSVFLMDGIQEKIDQVLRPNSLRNFDCK